MQIKSISHRTWNAWRSTSEYFENLKDTQGESLILTKYTMNGIPGKNVYRHFQNCNIIFFSFSIQMSFHIKIPIQAKKKSEQNIANLYTLFSGGKCNFQSYFSHNLLVDMKIHPSAKANKKSIYCYFESNYQNVCMCYRFWNQFIYIYCLINE